MLIIFLHLGLMVEGWEGKDVVLILLCSVFSNLKLALRTNTTVFNDFHIILSWAVNGPNFIRSLLPTFMSLRSPFCLQFPIFTVARRFGINSCPAAVIRRYKFYSRRDLFCAPPPARTQLLRAKCKKANKTLRQCFVASQKQQKTIEPIKVIWRRKFPINGKYHGMALSSKDKASQ